MFGGVELLEKSELNVDGLLGGQVMNDLCKGNVELIIIEGQPMTRSLQGLTVKVSRYYMAMQQVQ